MPAFPIATVTPEAAYVSGDKRHWAYAIGGMLAGSCVMVAVYAVASAPAGLFLGIASNQIAAKQTTIAFEQNLPRKMQVLRGVSGETAPADSHRADLPAGGLTEGDVSPVALDTLSAGGCISLTTASGKKLSFRIIGTHGKESQATKTATATIDLDVTACAPGSEAILKAVIESKTDEKQSAIQRNL
jgi:hypothetical protein